MINPRVVFFLVSLVAVFLVSHKVEAADISMAWMNDELDMSGAVIEREYISYVVRVSTDGGPAATLAVVPDRSYVWENVPLGCHSVYVTVYRSDADLESEPSSTVEKCVSEDTDDQLLQLRPKAPFDLRLIWRLLRG